MSYCKANTLALTGRATEGFLFDEMTDQIYEIAKGIAMQDNNLIKRLYHSMQLIRKVEEHVVAVYPTDVIKSPVHLSIGQEAVAAGICEAMRHDDIVSNTYRCHATFLAKGGDLNAMIGELYGKKNGCAAGKAGSMHLVDIKNGVLGSSAVVGTTIPVAAGYAFALQREAEKTGYQRIVVALFGDGATEEGVFYETINFAAIHKLPIIFVCENNKLAIHSPVERRWATPHICQRVQGYGIPTQKIINGDVFEIYNTTQSFINELRSGNGPAFIECDTYRYLEHVGPSDDHHEKYRNSAELAAWRERDQIDRLANMLEKTELKEINHTIECAIQRAVELTNQSTFPTTEELVSHVYAD